MRAAHVHRVIGNVTFLFQYPCNFGFDFRVRNQHLRLSRARALADARQKSSDRICNSAHTKIKRLPQSASWPDRCTACAFRSTARCQVINASSALASSSAFFTSDCEPTEVLITTFSTFGI